MSENSNQFLDALKQMQGVEVGDIVDVEVLDVEDGQINVALKTLVLKVLSLVVNTLQIVTQTYAI